MKKDFFASLWQTLRDIPRWLRPGLGIKRWFFFVMIGITLLGLGVAVIVIDLYRTDSSNPILLTLLSYASLRFIPRIWRAIIFGGLGVGIVIYGIYQLNRSLLKPFIRPGSDVFDQLTNFQRRERGPRIVAIGGGHGLATLLRGLKLHTGNLTAVVTVADDGGSS
ncbi:MAG TPA: 2-phospho-L-lactate transferase CofD family protein, partial [Anaerolineales bacterium]|nr:2-phospho-L-lactate transferase CofD family protein [Anaerolineales bacterium]